MIALYYNKMRSRGRGRGPGWLICLVLLVFAPVAAWAKPTTPDQARRVVQNWLLLDLKPLGCPLGQTVARVQTFRDAGGSPLYHVVYLKPAGLVFAAGDDLVEPIVGFLSGAVSYDPSPTTSLGYLVSRDIPGRVAKARELEAQGPGSSRQGTLMEAPSKWQDLDTGSLQSHPAGFSDERVPPLTQTQWGQEDAGNNTCYNMFTPDNRACGCGATALAQLMRYYNYPTAGIGQHGFVTFEDGKQIWAITRGGDGYGGPYNWNDMVLAPNGTTSYLQRQAIGFLTFDAGAAQNMHYDITISSSILGGKYPLMNTFMYSNTKWGFNSNNSLPITSLYQMMNPNLDAAMPVVLGGGGPKGGHFWLADGYGYALSTLYHHLNLGWDGAWNLWYNLPNIDSNPAMNVIDECWYNIYTSGVGEVISGRVLTPEGYPVAGATVQATGGGVSIQTTSNSRGIYAFTCLPAGTQFTIQAWGLNGTASISIGTGTSQNGTVNTGNQWGQNLILQPANRSLNASWVHANKIMPEAPWALASTTRRGWGIYFRGYENSVSWFHIPIPTPVIKENQRTVLVKAFVLFQTLGTAKVTDVTVWDGDSQIGAFDGFDMTGSHLAPDGYNVFPLWQTMNTGIEIAVRVEFGPKAADGSYAGIYFTTAGGDFYRWW